MIDNGTYDSTTDSVESLLPYLPRLLVDWMALEPGSRHQTVEGTIAFLDISGFTKLSEHLARRGKVGAEDLADAIDRCFTRLLGIAYEQGAMLLKFGGDALLLLFSERDHEQRACQAACDMRRELRDVGRLSVSGARVNLRMSVGIHSGTFNLFLVGSSHRELVITGPDATTTVRMESSAQAGQIVVSEATAARLPASFTTPLDSGGYLLRRSPSIPRLVDLRTVESTLRAEELMECIPVALREHLVAPHHEPEHRRATVAFVHFDGTDDLIRTRAPAGAAEALEELVTAAQEAAELYQVAFLGTDIDADGGKIILVAGAPSANGDDEERMLRAVRAIVDRRPQIPVRIGVHRGDVFAGDIGPTRRRTYTIMGDTVNLAARLMARASPGRILASPSVTDRVSVPFESSALEPFFVKGKARPVQAFEVGPILARSNSAPDDDRGRSASVPLVGRHAEIDRLISSLDTLSQGTGALIELVGEAGLGKTRLLDEVRTRAIAQADVIQQFNAACEPYESASPYSALRAWILLMLGIKTDCTAEQRIQQLLTALADADVSLLAWAPLFGVLLGVELPETPETAALEPKFRPDRLASAIADFLVRTTTIPMLVTIEDTHWMDEASAALLGRIAHIVPQCPLLICTTRRPEETGFRSEASQSMALTPLTIEEATRLIQKVTETVPLSPHATASLVERSGGNPLYLTELLAAIEDQDVGSLPDSVEALITARIDRLSPEDRRMLRQASVLGRTFPVEWLEKLLGAPAEQIWSRLGSFLRIESESMAGFEHALIRDAAYEGLPYRLRRELHAVVAEIIDNCSVRAGSDQSAVLSLHYLHAGQFGDAWYHGLRAANHAKDVYANIEAAELYERAIRAARQLTDVCTDELIAAQESLGDVRERIGAYSESEVAYRAARRLVGAEPLPHARLLQKIAVVQGWRDEYSRALGTLSRALRLLDDDPSLEAGRLRARLLAAYARYCEAEGAHRRTVKWCRKAIEAATEVGDKEAMADGLRMMDLALSELGQLTTPDNLLRALALFRELDDLTGQANALNLLGALAYWRGDWLEALDRYVEAKHAVERSGNTVLSLLLGANIAEILLDQGQLELAESLLGDASRATQAAGHRSGTAFALCNLARLASRQGHHNEAIALLDRAIADAERIGRTYEALEGRARKAECLLVSGQVASALQLADSTIAMARGLGGASQEPLLYRIRAVALARLGHIGDATAAFSDSLRVARERSAEYEIALTQTALATMLTRSGIVPPAELEENSDQILKKLRVVSLPALFG